MRVYESDEKGGSRIDGGCPRGPKWATVNKRTADGPKEVDK